MFSIISLAFKVDKFSRPDLIHDAPADWRDTPHGLGRYL